MNHVIRQILIQIGKRIRILTECLILTSQPITSCHLSEANQIYDVQGRDVVRLSGEVVLPVSGLPEPEALHVCIGVAERGVGVRGAAKVLQT